MASLNTHDQFARQAIALAGQARLAGNHPFGALLVLDGEVVLTAMNSVNSDRDPTGHAETNLVAAAIRRLSRSQIGRAVLYTSCEPCAMCVGKMYWADVRSLRRGWYMLVSGPSQRHNRRLLLAGRGRLSRRGISLSVVCSGWGTPRGRSAGRQTEFKPTSG